MDTSLLTVGRYTYTTDLRFEAFHSPHTDDWIVRLKNPRPSDSGFYGCQISTTPHRTQLIYLTVHGRFFSRLIFLCYDQTWKLQFLVHFPPPQNISMGISLPNHWWLDFTIEKPMSFRLWFLQPHIALIQSLKDLGGILSRSGNVKEFDFLCPFSKATEKTMFCFVSAFYWTENKKFVNNAQQCFAFTPSVQFKPNSYVDNILTWIHPSFLKSLELDLSMHFILFSSQPCQIFTRSIEFWKTVN